MIEPGPDHPIHIHSAPRRMRVRIEGHVIADTTEAVLLEEAGYPAVAYFPREDVEMGFFTETDHATSCPYKGRASYYTVKIEGRILENAAWSYREPYPAVARIKNRIAFYPDRFDVYETDVD